MKKDDIKAQVLAEWKGRITHKSLAAKYGISLSTLNRWIVQDKKKCAAPIA